MVKNMGMTERFLHGYLSREKPEYRETLEELTAFISYKSLDERDRKIYAKYIQELKPSMFNLSPAELALVELSLPSYSEVEEKAREKSGLSEKDLKILERHRERMKKRVFRTPGLNVLALYALKLLSFFRRDLREELEIEKSISERVYSEEYREILVERSKEVLKSSRLICLPIYMITGILLYLKTLNPLVEVAYASSILTSNILAHILYASERIRRGRYRMMVIPLQIAVVSISGAYIYYGTFNPVLIAVYLLTTLLPFWILGLIELSIGQYISDLVEKTWPYLPKRARRIIDKTRRFLAGIRVDRFDEEVIYEELYAASLRLEKVSSIPRYVFEEFRDRLEKRVIKVENPEEKLVSPYSLGYYRRELVLIEENGELRVLNRRALEELAIRYGVPVENFEKEVLKTPMKYLEVDLINGRIVYGRSVIGMYNFRNTALRKGIASKEVEACLLSLYASSLIAIKYL